MKFRTTTLGLTAIVFSVAAAFGTTADAQTITGDWEVDSGAMHGKLIPSSVVYSMTLNVTGDKFTAESGNLSSAGTIATDNQVTPAQVTFKIDNGDDPGRELKGIFKFEGQNLMITFSETDQFPNSFDSTSENKYLTLRYQIATGRNNLANSGNARQRPNRRPSRARQPVAPPPANDSGSSATSF